MLRLTTINNAFLQNTLLANPNVLREFPFLQHAKSAYQAIENCVPCQQSAARTNSDAAMEAAKRSLAEMPQSKKNKLKEILNAQQVRIYYVTGQGANKQRQRADF